MTCIDCHHREHTKPCKVWVNDGFAGQDLCNCLTGVPQATLHLSYLRPDLKDLLQDRRKLRAELKEVEREITWHEHEIAKWEKAK